MNPDAKHESTRRPSFDAAEEAVYSLELAAELTGVASQMILHYQEQGLISSVDPSASGSTQFDDEALRILRRIEQLRTACGLNVSGLKIMLSLIDEVECLRAALRARR